MRVLSNIIRLIVEENDEKDEHGSPGERHPKDGAPRIEIVDHETGQLRTKIWRGIEDKNVKSNLSRQLMKEKHVFENCETHCLTRCEEKGLKAAEGVVSCERWGNGATESHESTDDLSVEKDRGTTPVVNDGNPKDTAETQHEDTEIAGIVDAGGCEAPFDGLET